MGAIIAISCTRHKELTVVCVEAALRNSCIATGLLPEDESSISNAEGTRQGKLKWPVFSLLSN